MRDLAERIVIALSDFDNNVETDDGKEIEKLFDTHRPALGCVEGIKRAKIDFVYQVLTEKIKVGDKNG